MKKIFATVLAVLMVFAITAVTAFGAKSPDGFGTVDAAGPDDAPVSLEENCRGEITVEDIEDALDVLPDPPSGVTKKPNPETGRYM